MNASVGFLQFNPRIGAVEQNIQRIYALLRSISSADLVVCPELSLTGYAFKSKEEMKEAYVQQEQTKWFSRLVNMAVEKNTALCIGFIEKEKERYYNSAMFLTPSGKSVAYRKAHLFFREPLFFESGNTFPLLVKWRGVTYGIGICLDYLFPEYWRALATQGADVFCLPANIVTDNGQPLMNARSRENRVYSIVANRSGMERGIPFRGKSQMNGPDGTLLAEAEQEESIRILNININDARDKYLLRSGGVAYNNVLSDRRPMIYSQTREESF